MPVHWYYNRQALINDFGRVTDFLAPRNPHPDSILWRSTYVAPNARGEILHDQARYWGQRGIHYHQFFKAGENTLNAKICRCRTYCPISFLPSKTMLKVRANPNGDNALNN